MIDFRNKNTLWASVIASTLQHLGLSDVVVCPGSRSAPLTVALARHRDLKTIPILDERSAAFFALGIAKRTSIPTVLVCTSGTAGANFYPAVIEAQQSNVPLIIFTADRPPQLRNCHAGQTIEQLKLYGNYCNWHTELALPAANLEMLFYLRQNIIQAVRRSLLPFPGVVHLNVPFCEPLAPIEEPEIKALQSQFDLADFFEAVMPLPVTFSSLQVPIEQWRSYDRGIIIAGLAQPSKPGAYCRAVSFLSQLLSFPVLAEALSPVRHYASLNPYLISTYDFILREEKIAEELLPDLVIQVGELPTSKQLRNWLKSISCPRVIIDPRPQNFDPLHRKTIHLPTSIEQIDRERAKGLIYNKQTSLYCQQWCELETKIRQNINYEMMASDRLYEGKIAWLLSHSLPAKTPIFFANSMSVRNAEFFLQPNERQIVPYFCRGANGIDGTLSTALGIAHCNRPTVLVSGDLALLHDTNGFLISNKFQGHLTIILVNNNGGGIFEMLPISQFQDIFEDYFATPQIVDFANLAASYGIAYKAITHWQQLSKLLNNLPNEGIRILELKCDRQIDAKFLQTNFFKLTKKIKIKKN
ncbi:2-succinyl-5-enolpyruvyl-6-hydroxy-3-cyclohexene-1-carboxylic-acid synthase [Myxosarcina sp. GI1]|uniref:2-succinyl-5-enolpyruvyl-6-hydroxy-3- cyclohexene-1-carboxylic-acid synthase n=1 Tax=Myxosarcina sp. GI1 TaxID=1541065 RepID=UPI0005682BFB|nr:2-succinyl-5-enolpyruvyl-6-hydroxy-3-cyclohexene-1-carboxylic-acid synthase [Myxosarcina sp. GI1]